MGLPKWIAHRMNGRGIVASGGWIFTVGALALGLVCLHELFRMYEGLRPVKLAGFLALAGLAVAAQVGDDERAVLLALVAFVPVLFLLALAMPRSDGATLTEGMALTAFGVVWVGLAIAHAVMLRELPHGGGIVGDVLIGTFVGDSGAYFGGRALGRRKLAPRVSPNKTWEGLLAGIVGGTLAFWAFEAAYQEFLAGWQALLIGFCVAVAAPIGDLFESLIKRDLDVKDTGGLFGPHGGVLDRLDAVFFSVPVAYYVSLAVL